MPPRVTIIKSQRKINDRTGMYLSCVSSQPSIIFSSGDFLSLMQFVYLLTLNWPLFQILVPFSPRVNVTFLHSHTTVILQTKPLDCSWSNVRGEQYREWVISLSWLNFCLGMLFSCEAIGNRWKLLFLAQVSQLPNAKIHFNKLAKQKALLKVTKGFYVVVIFHL